MTQPNKHLANTHYHANERKELFLLALSAHHGNVSQACEYTGVRRREYNEWLMSDGEFADGVGEVAEEILDLAEDVIIGAMRDRNLTAAIYYTKCKGKKRGYIERGEVGDAKPAVTFNMNFSVPPKPQRIGEGKIIEVHEKED